MKVESTLKVIYNRYQLEPISFWSDLLSRNGRRMGSIYRALEIFRRRFPHSRIAARMLTDWETSESPAAHGKANDLFWSFDAVHYLPTYKVAPVEEGLRFAFEASPRMCFELNQRQLPFGCHAWTKFDRAFWEPHLVDAQ